jgi:membrane peptidoglycan carboxypeptidase
MGFLTSDRARRDGRVTFVQLLTALAGFVAFSVMGGILLAGLALPAVTVAGTAANGTATIFEALPREFDNTDLPQSSYIYASDRETLLATFFVQNRKVVPLEEISPFMQMAVVAVEDKRFWQHNGVDGEGLLRAAYEAVASDDLQGASTLTQQLVKNTLREAAEAEGDTEAAKAATEVSLERKIREWRLALAYEEKLNSIHGDECGKEPEVDCGKEQILESYLNIAQFGPSVYGVEAAAQFYFGIAASELDALQAATIAGITQNPTKWDPVRNPENAKIRRDIVLNVMLEQRMISNVEYYNFTRTSIEESLNLTYPKFSCAAAPLAPFFCDYVTKVIGKDEAFKDEGLNLLYRGGLNIITTLDVNAQGAANDELVAAIPPGDESGLATALVALRNDTGDILAMSQNRAFDPTSKEPNSTAINYSVDREMGGSRGFSPGSSFKPVILTEWLRTGHSLNQVVSGAIRDWDLKDWRANCEGGGGYVGKWKPGNSEGLAAVQQPVWQATANSVNTAYVAMASQLDLCDVRDTAEDIGFHRADGKPFELVPSMTLGSQNASPLTMASVYQTFANRGVHCTPRAILEIKDLDGNDVKFTDGTIVTPPPVNCSQVISTEVADGVTYGLSKVMEVGSGKRFQLAGRPSAGKTGTAQNNTHTWFAGYTPQISSVVWIGNPDKDVPQQFITINGKFYRYVFGSLLAGPTWKLFMDRALANYDAVGLPAVSPSVLNGVSRPVPDVKCLTEDEAQFELNKAGFLYENGGSLYSFECPAGTVAQVTPEVGTSLGPGATVYYYLSTDQLPSWWYNWPPGWNPNVPPSDYWGGPWPPVEWTTNPPTGWDPESWDPDPDPDPTPGPGD